MTRRIVSLATAVAVAMLGGIAIIRLNMVLYSIIFLALLGAITSVVLVSMLVEALLSRVLSDDEDTGTPPRPRDGHVKTKKGEKEKPVLKKLSEIDEGNSA